MECFALMDAREVSAVGITDQSGELVANLSASDLRRLDGHSFRLLALPVAEFISRRKGDAIGRRGAPFAEARRMAAAVETAVTGTGEGGEGGDRLDQSGAAVAVRDPEVDVDVDVAGLPLDESKAAAVSSAETGPRRGETEEGIDEDDDEGSASAFARDETRKAPAARESSAAAAADDASETAAAMARAEAMRESSRTFVELIFARPETTLRRTLQLLAAHSIHHVYVVDDADKPVAVVTPADVLRLFVVDDKNSQWNVVWAPQPRSCPGVPTERASERMGVGDAAGVATAAVTTPSQRGEDKKKLE